MPTSSQTTELTPQECSAIVFKLRHHAGASWEIIALAFGVPPHTVYIWAVQMSEVTPRQEEAFAAFSAHFARIDVEEMDFLAAAGLLTSELQRLMKENA